MKIAQSDYLNSVQYMLISACLVALYGLLVKKIEGVLALPITLFLRFFLPLVLLYLFGKIAGLHVKKVAYLKLHLLRALLVVIGQGCMLFYLLRGSIFMATLLFMTSPIFIPMVSKVVLRTKIEGMVWCNILLGFIGMVLVLRPTGGAVDYVAIVGIAAGFCNACSQVVFHQIAKKQDVYTLAIYLYGLCAVLSLPLLFFFLPHIALTGFKLPLIWLWLLLLSFVTISNQVVKSKAYKLVKQVASLAPFMYLAIVLSALLDWLFYHHLPDLWSICGAILIVSSGIIMVIMKPKVEKESIV